MKDRAPDEVAVNFEASYPETPEGNLQIFVTAPKFDYRASFIAIRQRIKKAFEGTFDRK